MRMIFTQETVDDNDVVGGAAVTMPAEDDRPDQSFWIARDEAETLIRALAKWFELDVTALG
jgi:hypothetical protein